MNDLAVCTCGTKLDDDDQFCPNCGAKNTAFNTLKSELDSPELISCEHCNQIHEPYDIFCRNCGYKINQTDDNVPNIDDQKLNESDEIDCIEVVRKEVVMTNIVGIVEEELEEDTF